MAGIDISLPELIKLRGKMLSGIVEANKSRLTLPGQRQATTRGRGIEFDATREYQTGDDIRNMAWRVTARSLKPHVKIYRSEKERPVWLAIDLSPSLYFGTRCMFKSVCAIQQAAAIGWNYLARRERIGAAIATSDKIKIHQPSATERNFLAILHSLATCSRQQPAYSDQHYLHDILVALQHQVRAGSLMFVISDFYRLDESAQKILALLARRAQTRLLCVYDPFEAEPPPPWRYLVTDGLQRALFHMDNARTRQQYQQQFQNRMQQLHAFARRNNIVLQLVRTDQQARGSL